MSADIFKPKTYGVKVGDLWVAIDFEAQAVMVTRKGAVHSTENLGGGFLLDRNRAGVVVGVEVLGGDIAEERE